jgi:hypothetical protein
MTHDIPYLAANNPIVGPVGGPVSLGIALTQAYGAPEQHLNFGTGMATIQIEDCQTKQLITVADQVLKVVRGRLKNQHAAYACRP